MTAGTQRATPQSKKPIRPKSLQEETETLNGIDDEDAEMGKEEENEDKEEEEEIRSEEDEWEDVSGGEQAPMTPQMRPREKKEDVKQVVDCDALADERQKEAPQKKDLSRGGEGKQSTKKQKQENNSKKKKLTKKSKE